MSIVNKQYCEMIESHQILKSGFQWQETMHIPFRAASPNPLTERFVRMKVMGEDKFTFLANDVNLDMADQILNLLKNPQGVSDWYFEGPQGIGKSFSFFFFVLQLRRFYTQNYRVIYVNNPNAWKKAPWRYIVNEVVYAFCGDEEKFNTLPKSMTLSEWYARLWNTGPANRQATLEEFLESVDDYCKEARLELLAVLDQENEISDKKIDKNQYEFPFNYYNGIPSVKYMITCASANNWTSVKKSQSWKNLNDKIKIPFKKFAWSENFLQYALKKYFESSNLAFDPKYEQIIQLAGSNAEEIFLVAQFCVENTGLEIDIDKVIDNYYNKRLNELNLIHKKFIEEQLKDDSTRRLFYEALTYLDTDFKLPLNLQDTYDKRLMYMEGDRVLSLFPIARKVLIENLANCFDVVEDMVRKYLLLQVTGSGHPIEFYIIHTMKQLCKNNQSLCLQIRGIHQSDAIVYECIFKSVQDLVTIPLEKPETTTLYVPISPRYPAIDCLIYDTKLNAIFPIQITLNQKNHKDSYQEWENKYHDRWNHVFNCQSSFIWLAGIVKNKTKKQDHKYFVSDFASLAKNNKGCFQIFNMMKGELDSKAQTYTDGTMKDENDSE